MMISFADAAVLGTSEQTRVMTEGLLVRIVRDFALAETQPAQVAPITRAVFAYAFERFEYAPMALRAEDDPVLAELWDNDDDDIHDIM